MESIKNNEDVLVKPVGLNNNLNTKKYFYIQISLLIIHIIFNYFLYESLSIKNNIANQWINVTIWFALLFVSTKLLSTNKNNERTQAERLISIVSFLVLVVSFVVAFARMLH